ncbi:MAG: hypothetical protein ACR2PY_03950 [Salinispira sp.]
MKLLKYKRSRMINDDWNFSDVDFARINLLVGASGTGKTRFLNTIINFLKQLTADKMFYTGNWVVEFEVNFQKYHYELIVDVRENNPNELYIKKEVLRELKNKKTLIVTAQIIH